MLNPDPQCPAMDVRPTVEELARAVRTLLGGELGNWHFDSRDWTTEDYDNHEIQKGRRANVKTMLAQILSVPEQPKPEVSATVKEMRNFRSAASVERETACRWANALASAEHRAIVYDSIASQREVQLKESEQTARDLAGRVEGQKQRIASLEGELKIALEAQWLYRDLLRSSAAIAERNGTGTHWPRWTTKLHKSGIHGVTAKTFRVLPSDLEGAAPDNPPEPAVDEHLKCPGCNFEFQVMKIDAEPAAEEAGWGERLHRCLEQENRPGEPQEDRWEAKSKRAHDCWDRIAAKFVAAYCASRPREKVEAIVSCREGISHGFESLADSTEFLATNGSAYFRRVLKEWHYHRATKPEREVP